MPRSERGLDNHHSEMIYQMGKLVKIRGPAVVCALIVLFGIIFLFGHESPGIQPSGLGEAQYANLRLGSEPSTAQESYVPEVIISAPWGEKNLVYDGEASPPGQFGYHVNEETEMGPSCFAVAPNGDIYIVDPLNKRLQKYTSGGSFVSTIPFASLGKDLRTISVVDLCVDRDDNIYLLLYGPRADWDKATEDNMGRVLKCDQQGNLLQTYPVLTGVASTANFVYCDEQGRIFMACRGVGPYQLGTSEHVFPLDQQRDSELDGFLGANAAGLDKNLFFQASALSKTPLNRRFLYYAISLNGDTVHTYGSRKGLEGSFLGCDSELNIFLTYSDREAHVVKVRKYGFAEVPTAEFTYMCDAAYLKVSSFGGSRTLTLDRGGNLYMLCYSQSEGIRMLKRHRQ
jgi:hypothetical protein